MTLASRKCDSKAVGQKRKSLTEEERKAPPKGLRDLLPEMRIPASVKEHLRSHRIWAQWSEIVGSELARVTCPVEIRSRVLTIQVAHQAWAQQLHFLKPSLMAKIRAVCEESKIKDLQFRVGKVEALPTYKSSSQKRDEFLETEPTPLSERQEMILRSIEDEELRQVIRHAMQAERARSLSLNPDRK